MIKFTKYPKSIVALTVLVVAFAISYSWTYTPHGRLDYRAALSLHLLSFTRAYKPDPDLDFEFNLPVNLIYGLSALMPKEQVSKTTDIRIASGDTEIPARIYWPSAVDDKDSAPPLIVYFHGGGFVVGSVDIFDALTRSLANATNSVVVSVDYRLAPRHPYPAAVNDCYAALIWAKENASALGADPDRIIVGGDSAGGNLAAVVALKAQQENGPSLAAQLLYYPAVDLTDKIYASKQNYLDGYGLSSDASAAFHSAYAGHVDDKSVPYISPLYAATADNLPPALIVTAGFDPLTDSATAYGNKLKAAGVHTTLRNYPKMIHGFMSVELFSQRRSALNDTKIFLDKYVRSQK